MSIASEITRLQGVKSDILTAIAAKGVTVPAGSDLDDCPGLIANIATGGSLPSGYVQIGNHVYDTVTIGNLEIITENLDYKFDGLNITSSLNTNPNGCYYDNDEALYGINAPYHCGMLYNWYAIKYLEDHKSELLPAGWRTMTQTDWESIKTTVGDANINKIKAWDSQIKSGFPSSWNGTNDTGLTLIPSGNCINGTFSQIGEYVHIGFLTQSSSYNYTARKIGSWGGSFPYGTDVDKNGFTYIRIVKDVT